MSDLNNLAIIAFKSILFCNKVQADFMYDDNINSRMEVETKFILNEKIDSAIIKIYKDWQSKVDDELFIGKIDGHKCIINKRVYDRLICNINHAN